MRRADLPLRSQSAWRASPPRTSAPRTSAPRTSTCRASPPQRRHVGLLDRERGRPNCGRRRWHGQVGLERNDDDGLNRIGGAPLELGSPDRDFGNCVRHGIRSRPVVHREFELGGDVGRWWSNRKFVEGSLHDGGEFHGALLCRGGALGGRRGCRSRHQQTERETHCDPPLARAASAAFSRSAPAAVPTLEDSEATTRRIVSMSASVMNVSTRDTSLPG